MNWVDVNKRQHGVIWCIFPGKTEENDEENLMIASFPSQIESGTPELDVAMLLTRLSSLVW